MNIYPALDLIRGHIVRLERGVYASAADYPITPLELAAQYAEAGAAALHLVDLEASRDGCARQLAEIAMITQAIHVPVQCGGGIRSKNDIECRLTVGCYRVVVGSVAVLKLDLFATWLAQFGSDCLVAALDVRTAGGEYLLAVDGWTRNSGVALWTRLDDLSAMGLKHVLCTDIERDGTLAGPNLDLYRELNCRYPALAVQASGGIATLDHLKALHDTGATAAVIGKALLTGRFSLREAIMAVSK